MHPELFDIPIIGFSVKTYGFFLMIGFLSAVWLAMRRAEKVGADPDVVLDMSFLALVFGVAGARLFYVVHYWHPHFDNAPNKLLAALDITKGGLEFLGGFLAAAAAVAVYAYRKKVSLRLYLDILAPGAMWGLAFGRLGCFFNGCCFGGLCVLPQAGPGPAPAPQPALAWAVRFPFGSPAFDQQWKRRQVTAPAELIVTGPDTPLPWLLPSNLLSLSVKKREAPFRAYEEAKKAYEQARSEDPTSEETARLAQRLEQARRVKERHERKLAALLRAEMFPSRRNPQRKTSVSELQALAARFRSQPVHPTQLYSSINAMLLSLLLSALFAVRKRHGMVIGVLFVLYPIPRAILEIIRVDNPVHAGLTASQWVGVAMIAVGAVYLYVLYRKLPERSPVLAQA
ncbi:MAG: hypothetical protein D6788_04780 [Planctomycetota bacterium]|nr:MAG: hypothetical protein D6788_04780 [Planctomycetota bacterium]